MDPIGFKNSYFPISLADATARPLKYLLQNLRCWILIAADVEDIAECIAEDVEGIDQNHDCEAGN